MRNDSSYQRGPERELGAKPNNEIRPGKSTFTITLLRCHSNISCLKERLVDRWFKIASYSECKEDSNETRRYIMHTVLRGKCLMGGWKAYLVRLSSSHFHWILFDSKEPIYWASRLSHWTVFVLCASKYFARSWGPKLKKKKGGLCCPLRLVANGRAL